MSLLQRHLLLEKYEKNAMEAKDDKALNELKSKPIDPRIYCKIGDFNLLLGNYTKGLSKCLNAIDGTEDSLYAYLYYVWCGQRCQHFRDTSH